MSSHLPLRATMRLQMHKGFTFADAAQQIEYFSQLGISHLYLSPILTARAGSIHGYDVIDYGSVNPELGGEEGLRALVEKLRAYDLGLIVDIVPNHMAVGNSDNRLWLDVLEWGAISRYARFFDIDWDVTDPAIKGRILAPFLGKPYGEVLNSQELILQFDKDSGRFYIAYFHHHFPIAPRTYHFVLKRGDAVLREFAAQFYELSGTQISARGEAFEKLRLEMAELARHIPEFAQSINHLLERFSAKTHKGREYLHALLEEQNYRLAWWRTAADEINWRRFFDVIDLAGIRIQEPAAFEIVHATIFRLYAEGLIDGVRVDHVDGLADPRTYCRRLRYRLQKLMRERPTNAPRGRPYILVEKILAAREALLQEWQVDGTTGYSFMNDVGALLHDPAGEQPLTELWTELTGKSGEFENEEMRARRRISQELFASDFNACAHALHVVARRDPSTRDWTLFAIRRVLAELLAHFPVYRTYIDGRGRNAVDEKLLQEIFSITRESCHPADRPLVDLFDRWFGGEPPYVIKSINARRARLRAIARFQQLSSPIAAKSVEDTAFYRHGRLLSRNEVGASPAQFSLSEQEFHQECINRVERFPRAMLATATHDHKRGEDLRARLTVLSEDHQHWSACVRDWCNRNSLLKKQQGDVLVPDAVDEYMLYQMLAGAWPLELELQDNKALEEFRERILAWQKKALREAKRHSSWAEPNELYEYACENFLLDLFDMHKSAGFLQDLYHLVQRIAWLGAINSLTQTLIKLTSPGVPDIYQGCELWDFSLVDPDNRRRVDFSLRKQLLQKNNVVYSAQQDKEKFWLEILHNWQSGEIKQYIIAKTLALRKIMPEVFCGGSYEPLDIHGELAKHVFGFIRRSSVAGKNSDDVAIMLVMRFPLSLVERGETLRITPEKWGNTSITLPADLQHLQWHCVLHEQSFAMKDNMPIGKLFSQLPLALLVRYENNSRS